MRQEEAQEALSSEESDALSDIELGEADSLLQHNHNHKRSHQHSSAAPDAVEQAQSTKASWTRLIRLALEQWRPISVGLAALLLRLPLALAMPHFMSKAVGRSIAAASDAERTSSPSDAYMYIRFFFASAVLNAALDWSVRTVALPLFIKPFGLLHAYMYMVTTVKACLQDQLVLLRARAATYCAHTAAACVRCHHAQFPLIL